MKLFRVGVAVFVLGSLWRQRRMAQSAGHGVLLASGTLVTSSHWPRRRSQSCRRDRLFWRVESFASLAQAQAAAGSDGSRGRVRWQGLAPHARSGRWIVGGRREDAGGGTDPPVAAPQYLLGSTKPAALRAASRQCHNHPGAEAAYVLAGEQTFRTPHGVMRIGAGKAEAGTARTRRCKSPAAARWT